MEKYLEENVLFQKGLNWVKHWERERVYNGFHLKTKNDRFTA